MWRQIISMGLLCLCTAANAADKTATSQQLQHIQSAIQSLNQTLDKDTASKAQLFAQLKQQNRQISALNKTLYQLKQQIQQTRQQLSTLQQQLATQTTSQQQQLQALEVQLRSAYMQSQPSLLKILLNQTDPAMLARENRYFYYFNVARQQQIRDISTQLASLSKAQKAAFLRQKALQNLYQQQQDKQQQLKQKLKKRQQTLALLDQKISSQRTRLQQLQQQAQALQNLLNDLDNPHRQLPSSDFSFIHSKGRLHWPVQGKLLARYGHSRNIGKLRWQGIVIGALPGEEVKAVAPGKVVFADWLRGFGLLVIIDHGHQYMTLYGYNRALLKQAGDTVAAGDIIALSGDRGLQHHPGLYFEIRHQGSPTNPLDWLRKQG